MTQGDRPIDVLCVGEALIDFLPDGKGKRVRDVERWTRCPGGSPANVAIGVARLGARSAFLGVVGEDEFGAFLRGALESEGVSAACLRHTKQARTGLVFVSIAEDGDRSFAFYRKPSAEFLLDVSDVDRAPLQGSRIVHLGTNSLLLPGAADAAKALVRRAKAAGCVTSCDPNLRLHVWDDPEILRALIADLLRHADVIKVAEDEAEFCTGEKDPTKALRKMEAMGAKLGVVTLGAKGAVYVFKGALAEVEAPVVEAVDATGAGDGFVAGLLTQLAGELVQGRGVEDLRPERIHEMVLLACRIGAAVVTRLGAVAGLPRRSELSRLPR